MKMRVMKASGALEGFDEEKLAQSLRRAGISGEMVDKTVEYAKTRLTDQASTNLIHTNVQELLRREGLYGCSFNYDLKRAIMRLGPTGYPFEEFVAKILSARGFQTQVGVTVSGRCISHEIDIEASNDSEHYFIECKFHNQLGIKTDVQVALYTWARFEDVRGGLSTDHGEIHRSFLVTNTAISKDVVSYARCVEMRILSWDYPVEESLHDMIVAARLHPITVLQNLTASQQASLLSRGIVTLKELAIFLSQKEELLQNFSLDEANRILAEIKTFEG